MDLRVYLEDEVVWMWIYGQEETEAVNMEHAITIELQDVEGRALVIANMINEEEILLKSCDSMSDARDWLKHQMVAMNDRNAGR